MRHLIERALISLIGNVFRTLPRRWSLYLGRVFGLSGYYLASGRRKLALENIRLAFGSEMDQEKVRKTARKSFEFLGMNLAEFFRLPLLNRDNVGNLTVFEGEENVAGAMKTGRGVLVLGGHIGCWDMGPTSVALRGYPVSVISKVSRSEALNRLWMNYRRDSGVAVLTGRGTMKGSISQLRKGGIVVFALDQNARRSEGVFVPFFGRDACTLASLAILARRTGAPVVPAYSYRDGDVHRIVVERPMLHEEREDADADVLERTRQYTRWIEDTIRRHPEQWTWLHDRWKTRPKGEQRNGGAV